MAKQPRSFPSLADAIDALLEAFRTYGIPTADYDPLSDPDGGARLYPTDVEFDRLRELHARVIGLAAAAGLPSPPAIEKTGLPIYARVFLTASGNPPAYHLKQTPNARARDNWETKLRDLRTAAEAWQASKAGARPTANQPMPKSAVAKEMTGKVRRKRATSFAHWAFGMETENRWHLFRRVIENGRSQWRLQRRVQGLPRGKLQQIMQKLAKGEGFVSQAELTAELCRVPPSNPTKFKGQVTVPLARLRRVILANLKIDSDQDPIPWSAAQQGWRAEVQVGYAVKEDTQLVFRTHTEVQP